MSKTSEMVTRYLDGYEIMTHEDAIVMYVPRWKTDPRPFATPGDYENESDRPRFSGASLHAVAKPFSAGDDAFVSWLGESHGLRWEHYRDGSAGFRRTLRNEFKESRQGRLSASETADAWTPEPSGRPADATAAQSV